MLSVVLPEKIYVATSLFASGKDALKELDGDAPFDWVIRNRRFISFRDPEGTALMAVLDQGTVETVETSAVSASDDIDDENAFIELLGRTLRVQFDDRLSFDKDSRSLYFRAKAMNKGWKYPYRSLINETSALVVSPWVRKKDGKIGNVRHHSQQPCARLGPRRPAGDAGDSAETQRQGDGRRTQLSRSACTGSAEPWQSAAPDLCVWIDVERYPARVGCDTRRSRRQLAARPVRGERVGGR
jgi:hypothetical protein